MPQQPIDALFTDDDIPVRSASGEFRVIRSGVAPTKPAPPVSAPPLVRQAPPPPSHPRPIQPAQSSDQIQKLKELLGVRSDDDVLDRRLRNCALALQQGVRSPEQTITLLTKEVAVGGFGVAASVAHQVVALVTGQAVVQSAPPTNHPATPQKSPAAPPPPPRPVPPHRFTADELRHELPPARRQAVTEEQGGLGDFGRSQVAKAAAALPAVPRLFRRPSALTSMVRRSSGPVARPVPPARPAPAAPTEGFGERLWGLVSGRNRGSVRTAPPRPAAVRQPVAPPPPPAPSRGKVTDVVVPPPRLVGPIDELRTFRVVDFRRLSADPLVAIQKIHEKLDRLSTVSFSQWLAGVAAWRESEVYRLYVALGQEGLSRRQPLGAVIAAHQAAKQPFLSENEFAALGKLHKMLEYENGAPPR